MGHFTSFATISKGRTETARIEFQRFSDMIHKKMLSDTIVIIPEKYPAAGAINDGTIMLMTYNIDRWIRCNNVLIHESGYYEFRKNWSVGGIDTWFAGGSIETYRVMPLIGY